jgi:hypothetical protein
MAYSSVKALVEDRSATASCSLNELACACGGVGSHLGTTFSASLLGLVEQLGFARLPCAENSVVT